MGGVRQLTGAHGTRN